ncbi:MAG: arylsulfotransferase family protein [Thermoleophilia bacterium]|nr:arylsulfotransferase family protein [Thermoleophilia bacterium]
MTKSSKFLAMSVALAVALVAGIALVEIGGDSTSGENAGNSGSLAKAAAPSSSGGPYRTRPDLRPPKMTIKQLTPGATDQKIFVGSKVSGAAIYDGEGEPVWFLPSVSMDFRTQTYRGKPVLTWFQAPTKGSGLKRNAYKIANRNYKVIKKVYPAHGHGADSHEFRLTRRNTAFVTAYSSTRANLSSIGGPSDGPVSESVAQEVDVKTGRLIWEWHSLNHVPIRDTFVNKSRRPGEPIDYFHINSVSGTPDGNILISGRGTNAVYKVSRKTGRIIWTLGGKSSDFNMGKEAVFRQQHDARLISGGRVSLFDNTTSPTTTRKPREQSRALVLKLNHRKNTATVDHEFYNPAKPLSTQQANVQALNNGNFFVGWGGVPLISEHRPDGKIVFDAKLEGINSFYRAYRQKWSGKAPGRVALVAQGVGPDKTKLWISWNGDSSVRDWQVYAGKGRNSLRRAGVRARDGFETVTAIPRSAKIIRVKGLNAKGKAIGSSVPVKVR